MGVTCYFRVRNVFVLSWEFFNFGRVRISFGSEGWVRFGWGDGNFYFFFSIDLLFVVGVVISVIRVFDFFF